MENLSLTDLKELLIINGIDKNFVNGLLSVRDY